MLMRGSLASAVLVCMILAVIRCAAGELPQDSTKRQSDAILHARLVAANTTMVSAWDVPRNPLTDSALGDSPRADQIRKGFKLFVQTPREAPRYAGNMLTCANCHLNAGQRELALPLVGVARIFPEYNKREGRVFSLEDRIVGCFMRSENATGRSRAYPDTESAEVVAIAAYINWLSEGISAGEKLPWRGHNVIAPDSIIPVKKLDPVRGKVLFMSNCRSCHGSDGQGIQIGDKKAGPLWGRNSWNDGAGAARVYTLAGFIRYAMPYLNPGSLADEEAQQIAAFINSMSRPVYPLKDRDYMVTPIPGDAVYYQRRPRGTGK